MSLVSLVAEVGFEPHDLRVMSPTSYQAAPLRDVMVPEAGIEPVRERISRDFKSRASANFAIPAFSIGFSVCTRHYNTYSGDCQYFFGKIRRDAGKRAGYIAKMRGKAYTPCRFLVLRFSFAFSLYARRRRIFRYFQNIFRRGQKRRVLLCADCVRRFFLLCRFGAAFYFSFFPSEKAFPTVSPITA